MTRIGFLSLLCGLLLSTAADAAYIGSAPLLVPNGGTGNTSNTQYGILVGAGTSPIVAVTGGAGQLLQSAASANPAFTPTPTLGISGVTTGSLALAVSGGGTVTLVPTGGTFNWNFPGGAGSSGQLLSSAGGGASAMTWQNLCSLLSAGSNVSISGTTTCTISTSGIAYSLATYTSNTSPLTLASSTGLTEVISQATAGAITINLPSSSLVAAQFECVKDGTNNFGTYNATVKTTDSSTIDGVAGTTGYTMNQAHQANCFQYDGTSKWYVM